jgi:hypothetical protein
MTPHAVVDTISTDAALLRGFSFVLLFFFFKFVSLFAHLLDYDSKTILVQLLMVPGG